jgi:hypothetical protein
MQFVFCLQFHVCKHCPVIDIHHKREGIIITSSLFLLKSSNNKKKGGGMKAVCVWVVSHKIELVATRSNKM